MLFFFLIILCIRLIHLDQMVKEDGSPHTAHTTAPVPAIIVNYPEEITLHKGILADVSPTLLKLMNVEQPAEMTGTPLF